MKVQSIEFRRMRNGEYFQFHTQFIQLLSRSGAANLKVEAQFEAYLPFYRRADEALKKATSSALTEKLRNANKRRGMAFRGLVGNNRAGLQHFRPEVQEAAKKLSILFNAYGNLARKPFNEQTSGVHHLVRRLNERFAAELQNVGLQEWVAELEAANNEFATLYRERLDESAQQTTAVLGQERKNMDTAYKQLVQRLNALVVVEGEQAYGDFIGALNRLLSEYKTTLKERMAKAKATATATATAKKRG